MCGASVHVYCVLDSSSTWTDTTTPEVALPIHVSALSVFSYHCGVYLPHRASLTLKADSIVFLLSALKRGSAALGLSLHLRRGLRHWASLHLRGVCGVGRLSELKRVSAALGDFLHLRRGVRHWASLPRLEEQTSELRRPQVYV